MLVHFDTARADCINLCNFISFKSVKGVLAEEEDTVYQLVLESGIIDIEVYGTMYVFIWIARQHWQISSVLLRG